MKYYKPTISISLPFPLVSYSWQSTGISESGIDRLSGQIILQEVQGQFFDDDPIRQFKRGDEVIVTYGNLPYKFYIAKVQKQGHFPYRVVDITLVDIFAIREINEPTFSMEDLGLCNGSLVSKSAIISKLLSLNNIPHEITVPGSFNVTFQKLDNESSIKLAGKIAYESGGYTLTQDPDGISRSKHYGGGSFLGSYDAHYDCDSFNDLNKDDAPAQRQEVTGYLLTPDFNYRKPYKSVREIKNESNKVIARITYETFYDSFTVLEGIRLAPFNTGLSICTETRLTIEKRRKDISDSTSSGLVEATQERVFQFKNRAGNIIYERTQNYINGLLYTVDEQTMADFDQLPPRPNGLILSEVKERYFNLDPYGFIDRERNWLSQTYGISTPGLFPFDTSFMMVSERDTKWIKKGVTHYKPETVESVAVVNYSYRVDIDGSIISNKETSALTSNLGTNNWTRSQRVYTLLDIPAPKVSTTKVSVSYINRAVVNENDKGEENPPAVSYCNGEIIGACDSPEFPVVETQISKTVGIISDIGIVKEEKHTHLDLPTTTANLGTFANFVQKYRTESFWGKNVTLHPVTHFSIGDKVTVIEKCPSGLMAYDLNIFGRSLSHSPERDLIALSCGLENARLIAGFTRNPAYDPSSPVDEDNQPIIEGATLSNNPVVIAYIEDLPLNTGSSFTISDNADTLSVILNTGSSLSVTAIEPSVIVNISEEIAVLSEPSVIINVSGEIAVINDTSLVVNISSDVPVLNEPSIIANI